MSDGRHASFLAAALSAIPGSAARAMEKASRIVEAECDVMGRMSDLLCEADAVIHENDVPRFREIMEELAAFALAQAATCAAPGVTLS